MILLHRLSLNETYLHAENESDPFQHEWEERTSAISLTNKWVLFFVRLVDLFSASLPGVAVFLLAELRMNVVHVTPPQ